MALVHEMASSDDESSGCSVASFYKLILKPRLDLEKLRIPSKFMITHGSDLSNIIYLKTLPGNVWKFDLIREEDKAFLQKGWPEFVKFYSLDHGHFLMFHYQGNSHFDVVICDTSASEIMYPFFDSDACNERPSKKSKQTHDLPKTNLSKKAKDVHKVMDADDKLILAKLRGTDHFTPKEDKRIRAYAADQCKHPSFASKMQASFIKPGKQLGVPKEFARKFLHLEPPFDCEYNLQTNDDGKLWAVKLVGKKSHVRFTIGWQTFVSENKLKVGDMCIFELINKQMFKVHILKN